MKKILGFLIVFSALLSGCATKPTAFLAPPAFNKFSKQKASDPKDLALLWAQSYSKAMDLVKNGDQKEACPLFLDLSEQEAFALKEAALVRSLEVCEYSNRKLKKIWNKSQIPDYLEESYAQISLNLAQKNKLSEYVARFSFELAKFSATPTEKIKLIKKAMDLAREEGEDEDYAHYKSRLLELSPSLREDIDDKNIFAIAKDFESHRNFERARELYQQIIEGEYKLNEKVKAFNALRMSYKVERNLKTFLTKTFEMESFLAELVKANTDDSKTVEAWLDAKIALARAVWTDHRYKEAKNLIEEIIDSNLGSNYQKGVAHNVLASLYLEKKQYKEAISVLKKASELNISDTSLLENIQWSLVWNFYLLKKNKDVQQFALKFIDKSTNPNFIAKLNFWRAKSLRRAHKVKEATLILKSLISEDPFGYYGMLASAETQTPITPIEIKNFEKKASGNLRLDWLILIDEKEWAQNELKSINGQFKTYAQREKIMPWYALTEWYQGGMRQIFNFKPTQRNDLTNKYINVIYPTAYIQLVSKAAKKFNIPKELIWAIIRQESAFVANERSWADAFGLMQLIPEKGKEFSKRYQIPYQDYNSLYLPEVNIEMGSALLSELKKKYKGKFAQTVAAYNASEEAIANWEKERFRGDYLEFIEMIPYEETRTYIKLVFRNFVTYKRISARKPFLIKTDFFAKAFSE